MQMTDLLLGDFIAESYHAGTQSYLVSSDVGIHVTVDETFDNDHRVVSQRAPSKGRFIFSAADSGDHRICFTPSNAPSAGWLSNGVPAQGGIKFTLDMAIGETSQIESNDKGKVSEMVQKVRDLNARLQDIRREQVFQRVCLPGWPRKIVDEGWPLMHSVQEREAEFRDQSETTNARVVRWTLIQLAVLGITCAWQLSHLRAFFIKQKLT